MTTYCEDCGCAVYNGACTNCHESLYILDQYVEQNMDLPSDDSDFMKEVARDSADVARKYKPPGSVWCELCQDNHTSPACIGVSRY